MSFCTPFSYPGRRDLSTAEAWACLQRVRAILRGRNEPLPCFIPGLDLRLVWNGAAVQLCSVHTASSYSHASHFHQQIRMTHRPTRISRDEINLCGSQTYAFDKVHHIDFWTPLGELRRRAVMTGWCRGLINHRESRQTSQMFPVNMGRWNELSDRKVCKFSRMFTSRTYPFATKMNYGVIMGNLIVWFHFLF